MLDGFLREECEQNKEYTVKIRKFKLFSKMPVYTGFQRSAVVCLVVAGPGAGADPGGGGAHAVCQLEGKGRGGEEAAEKRRVATEETFKRVKKDRGESE